MRQTAEFFDGYAHSLERIYQQPSIFDRMVRGMFARGEKFFAGCQPVAGKRIIDIGCGTGVLTAKLAEQGAKFVLGVDFSKGMLELAREKTQAAFLDHQCVFVLADFFKPPLSPQMKYDYALVLGVMDYIGNPKEFIDKVLRFTQAKAFFSFPKDGGALVLLRKAIYKRRCPLFLYTHEQINDLFRDFADRNKVTIEDIGKEFFVTVEK